MLHRCVDPSLFCTLLAWPQGKFQTSESAGDGTTRRENGQHPASRRPQVLANADILLANTAKIIKMAKKSVLGIHGQVKRVRNLRKHAVNILCCEGSDCFGVDRCSI